MSDLVDTDYWIETWDRDQTRAGQLEANQGGQLVPDHDQLWTLNEFVEYDSMIAQAPFDSLPFSAGAFGLVAPQSEAVPDSIDANQVGTQQDEYVSSGVSSSIISIHHSVLYLPNTCASCSGPLDKSEQALNFVHPAFYCNNSQELDHQTLACQDPQCSMKFSDIKDLKNHSTKQNHVALNCSIGRCNSALIASTREIANHFDAQHPDIGGYICAKCGIGFKILTHLINHCWGDGHAGFVCQFPDCGVDCIEIKDLKRHQIIHQRNTTTYPCGHCRTYRGNNGFKRKDHLVQHMRNYHRMEAYALVDGRCRVCYFKYTSLDGLAKHMLEAHHSLPYVCQETNCDRVGMNGFENDKDLKAHSKNDHISPYQCTQSGCDRVGNKGWKRKIDMIKHLQKAHGLTVDAQTIE